MVTVNESSHPSSKVYVYRGLAKQGQMCYNNGMIGEKVYIKLCSFAHLFKGNKTANEYLSLIRKIMKPYNVKVNKVIDYNNIAASIITIGGFYDSELEFGNKDIELYFIVNQNEKNNIFNLNDDDIKILLNELFKTLMHEERHRYQYSKRQYVQTRSYRSCASDTDLRREMDYYGDSDELDAYAREAAIETNLNGYSFTLAKYRELFESEYKILNRFLKKYYKALNES